jgi:hypothetical protein
VGLGWPLLDVGRLALFAEVKKDWEEGVGVGLGGRGWTLGGWRCLRR